jgi:hypothetical protein
MRSLIFEYNREYRPPAPFVEVELDGYDPDKESVTVSAFVDSGGDGTLIPFSMLTRLGARFVDEVFLLGTARGRLRRERFKVAVTIGGERVGNIDAVATDGDEVILGRDVLNYFEIRCRGVALQPFHIGMRRASVSYKKDLG